MFSKIVEEQFLETYDKHSDAIFRFCYFKLSDHEKAEEVTQEAFTRTWEYIQKDKKVENLRAFVYRVAKNIIVDYYRKHKEISLDQLHDQGFDPSLWEHMRWGDMVDGTRIIGIIKRLDEKYREVLLLRYVNNLSVKEIAEIVGERENHISVRLHRGLKQLKGILGKTV